MHPDQARPTHTVASLAAALSAQHNVVYLRPAQQQKMLTHLEKEAPYQRDMLAAAFRKTRCVFLTPEGIHMILTAIQTYRKVAKLIREAAGELDTRLDGGGNPELAHILNDERLSRRGEIIRLAESFESDADGMAETLHAGISQTTETMATVQ